MARPRKPVAQRQNRATDNVKALRLVTGDSAVVEIPPDPGWLEEWQSAWGLFWVEESLVRLLAPSHVPQLRRLFDLLNRESVLWRVHDAEPLGKEGRAAGQMALKIASEIRQLSDRFGFSPKALLGLGVQLGQGAARSLQELAEGRVEDGPATLVDPRTLEV